MPIELIDKIKQKNKGTFPLVEAQDVEVSKGKRLPEALAEKLSTNELNTAINVALEKAKELVKKYSDYIKYPIKMSVTSNKPKKDENGNNIEGEYESLMVRKERMVKMAKMEQMVFLLLTLGMAQHLP